MSKVKIVVVEPNKAPYVAFADGSLTNYQKIVGGYIEVVYDKGGGVIVLNEDGKLLGLPKNRAYHGDVLCGTFFIVGVSGDDFASLTTEQVHYYMSVFEMPDVFTPESENINALLKWLDSMGK